MDAVEGDIASVDIRYRHHAGDYFAAFASAARHSRFVAGMAGYLILTGGAMVVFWGDKTSLVILLAGVLFLTGYLPAAVSLVAVWRRRRLLTEELTLSADAKGVRWSRAGARSDVEWAALRRVRDLRTAFLIDYGTGAGALVPKKAFDAAALARFRTLAGGAGVLDASSPAVDLAIGSLIGVAVGVLFMLAMIALYHT